MCYKISKLHVSSFDFACPCATSCDLQVIRLLNIIVVSSQAGDKISADLANSGYYREFLSKIKKSHI
jgi:hypothetical protein